MLKFGRAAKILADSRDRCGMGVCLPAVRRAVDLTKTAAPIGSRFYITEMQALIQTPIGLG